MHPVDFSTAVTYAKDFEAADHGNKKWEFATTVVNKITLKPIAVLIVIHNRKISIGILIAATCNISTAVTNSLSTTTINSNTATKSSYNNIQKPQIQSNPKLEIGNDSSLTDSQFIKLTIKITPADLLVTPEDAAFSKQKTNQKPLICNIPPAASTEDKSLTAIFLFELEEITSVLLFSGAALNTKPITAMYTDAKIDAGSIITKQLMNQLGHQVDRAASARIITADEATKTLIGEIDDFSFKVNGIIVSIKVLVMKATQYQALIDNDWLTKVNVILDWTMQELQLSQNDQHTRVPAICDHFKTINTIAPLIEFEEEEKKPTWEAYQVSWANDNHNELLPILSWNNNNNEKEKHTWRTTINAWINNSQSKLLLTISWKEKGKEKEKEENVLGEIELTKDTTKGWTSSYSVYQPLSQLCQMKTIGCKHIIIANHAIANAMDIQSAKASRTMNHVSLVANSYLTKRCETTFLVKKEHATLHANKIWRMVNAKVQEVIFSKILEIKNNPFEQVDIILIPNSDVFLDIETNPEDFHEHYQNLAPTRKEQEQQLAQLNT
ncbi:hypothetical protein G9A89_006491 [Geosiphon pyriformis]|nr:hypothetical protein G9A89_006491 [Geosiphon pyriformis]